ncbi:MAG: hypothetical protein HOC18_10920 [Candidatus Marinimicrobia bacterium]|jgi:hypothetical protein|nr:hypothetical protein [Candidatus Neomarinimicrobiota bacterium]
MAMRSQVYEWDAGRSGGGTLSFGQKYSIFIGGVGNNITKPAETTATQFCVIEDCAVSPTDYGTQSATAIGTDGSNGPRAYGQVRINTTDYFLDPDNIGNDGIPGSASPYPRSIAFQPSFNLYPDVYVLPGQTWDVLYTHYTGTVSVTATGEHQAFVKYTLYDGPDALIANKLLEMGVSVNPGNVDWYKRTLIQGA